MSAILFPVKSERLTPEQFICKVNAPTQNIEKSRFIPPKLGDNSFGYFEVTYKHAELKRV